jgi:CubicO group peptidase (beta-lactamase class C family)
MPSEPADIAAELLDHPVGRGPSAVVLRIADGSGDRVGFHAGHRQTYRMSDGRPEPLADPAPVGDGDLFDLASISKAAATTAAVMSLTDAGALDVEAPARDWLPAMPPEVTVSHLLRHRAGLPEWWPVYAERGRDEEDIIAGLAPRYPVDAGRHYSDLGFMLIGLIVERAAGRPLDEAARQLVFEPAGMATAHYRPGGAGLDLPVVATAHGDWYERRMLATGQPYPVGIPPEAFGGWREHTLVGEVHDGNAWHSFGGVAGHAGLFATADDLVAFGRALLGSLGGDGPWRAETVRRFFAAGPDDGQGLGFWRWPEHGAAGHGGFTGTRFAVLPEAGPGAGPAGGLVAVLLTNRVHTAPGDLLDLGPWWDRILAAAAR